MKYAIALEAIGADRATYMKLRRRGLAQMEPGREARYLALNYQQPWVAEIVAVCGLWFDRRFLRGQHDYSGAGGLGSRGVMVYYLLDEGPIYEVFARLTWKRSDRYFCRVTAGRLERIVREEVDRCLSTSAG